MILEAITTLQNPGLPPGSSEKIGLLVLGYIVFVLPVCAFKSK
jgi:hypothetical protein